MRDEKIDEKLYVSRIIIEKMVSFLNEISLVERESVGQKILLARV